MLSAIANNLYNGSMLVFLQSCPDNSKLCYTHSHTILDFASNASPVDAFHAPPPCKVLISPLPQAPPPLFTSLRSGFYRSTIARTHCQ